MRAIGGKLCPKVGKNTYLYVYYEGYNVPYMLRTDINFSRRDSMHPRGSYGSSLANGNRSEFHNPRSEIQRTFMVPFRANFETLSSEGRGWTGGNRFVPFNSSPGRVRVSLDL